MQQAGAPPLPLRSCPLLLDEESEATEGERSKALEVPMLRARPGKWALAVLEELALLALAVSLAGWRGR
jgi:hypothetical protein